LGSLNFFSEKTLMTSIGPFQQNPMPSHSQDSSIFSVLFAVGCVAVPMICGTVWVQKLQRKIEELELLVEDYHRIQDDEHEHLNDLFVKTEGLATKEAVNTKQEYDPDDEIEEGVYQAWTGVSTSEDYTLVIQIWREKDTSYNANKKWMDLSGVEDASSIVRDFYLGNGTAEFDWTPRTEGFDVSETMVNGWGSVIRLQMTLLEKDCKNCNERLHTCLKQKLVRWSRTTISPRQSETLSVA
jgi:hypothetical protein